MSHVHDLRRAEAFGVISSREFDRLIDDAIEMDAIEDRREQLAYERMESEYYHSEIYLKRLLPKDELSTENDK